MSTNVSKQKREDLLAKIKAIRTYIATAPQDENTANLLAYLSELEKDVGASLTKIEPFLVKSYEARFARCYDFAAAKVMI